MRRTGSGRWKRCCAGVPGATREWVGKSALAGDVLARQLDTAGASRRDFALLNNDTKAMLEAYARGVNAFIAQGAWPAEYAILGARPAAWEPWHSIAVMRQIGFLMGSVWWKLWRAAALPIVGADEISASCVSTMAATTCCAFRPAPRARAISQRSPT